MQRKHTNVSCVCCCRVKCRCKIVKILSVIQHCYYSKLISPAIFKLYVPVFERNYIQPSLHWFYTLHINAALKQKAVCMFMAFFRRIVWLHRTVWRITGCAVYRLLWVLQQNILRDQTAVINYEAVSAKYYKCVRILVLFVWQAKSIFSIQNFIFICGQLGSTDFFHITS